jgi:SWI/SNF-related matrix-associated actin-dependent regulator 1 of chromatin subfamily A
MVIMFDGARFVARCLFDERYKPKQAGFVWDSSAQVWYTSSPGIASRLIHYADERAKKEIENSALVVTNWAGAIPVPPGLDPLPFQINQAVPFALSRNRSYLALDPGLGKTICAALIRNALSYPTVYICPPFLMGNVEEEFAKWSTGQPRIVRLEHFKRASTADILIVPDSMLARETTLSSVIGFAGRRKTLLIIDEAHRFKTLSSERSKALYRKIQPAFTHSVFLSGTPMPNRPMELFPVISRNCPELIDHFDQFRFGLKYCAGFQGPWGWDFSGSSNVGELSKRIMGKFMLRVKKADVLPELPEKSEELVFVDDDLPVELAEMSRHILNKYSPEDLMRGRIGEEQLATYRRKLGAVKVKPALDFLRNVLSGGTESVLVFAHHRDVISGLMAGLSEFKPMAITGSVERDERFEIVKEFQTNPDKRVLILNITAGGVGFNLTKASRVVFAEFSWVPGENDQAIDRAHRIGQNEKVLVQYMLHRNSVDRAVLETVLAKRKQIQKLA